MYIDKATAIRLTEKQIEVYETLLSCVPAIEEVVRKFDGKVANKRIETALQEIHHGIFFRRNQNSENWELTITEWENRYVQGEPDKSGYRGMHYVSQNTLYLAEEYSGHFMADGGRLIADKLIEQIERKRESYARDVETMKDQLYRVDSLIARRDEIYKMRHEFNNSINCFLEEYFNLKA